MSLMPNTLRAAVPIKSSNNRYEAHYPAGNKPGSAIALSATLSSVANAQANLQTAIRMGADFKTISYLQGALQAAIADGAAYTIPAGSFNFGTNSSAITDFVGGAALEATALDTEFNAIMSSKWQHYAADGAAKRWRVKGAYSPPGRTRALLWDSTAAENQSGSTGNQGQSSFVFNPSATISQLYIRRRAYMDIPSGRTAQLKMIRLISYLSGETYPGGGTTDPVYDGWAPNMYWTVSPSTGTTGGGKIATNNGVSNPPYFAGGAINFDDTYVNWNPNVGDEALPRWDWYDQEFGFKDSSSFGAADAYMYYTARRVSDGVLVCNHRWGPMQVSTSGETAHFRGVNFQTGFFNGDNNGTTYESGLSKFSQYDIFVSVNSEARVLLADTSTITPTTKFETQELRPGEWSSGAVGVNLNKGAFASLSGKYLYVWKSDGTLANTTGIALP